MLGCQIYHRMITLNIHEMIEHCKVNINENRIKLPILCLVQFIVMKNALDQICPQNPVFQFA